LSLAGILANITLYPEGYMIENVSTRVWLCIWALAVLFAFLSVTDIALTIGNHVATDAFSEANALRAVDAFIKEGVGASYGLPRTGYGLLYPDHGHARQPDSYVYTHYPPGPEFLLLLYRRVFGELNVALFRIFNCYIFIVGAIFLSQSLIVRLGIARVCLLTLLMGIIPATLGMAFGLHYQGIAFSLILVQLGVLARVYSGQMRLRSALVALGLLGFLQGWFSFDYFFIVSLVSAPACLLFTLTATPPNLRKFIALTVAACGGFTLAHALHFGQNVLYLGGVWPAIIDISTAARARSHSDVGMPYFGASIRALRDYVTIHPAREEYLGFMASAVTIGLGVIILAPTYQITILSTRYRIPWRAKVGVLLAAVVSLSWVAAMPAHAMIHGHFIPRHLTIVSFFVVCALLLIPQRNRDRSEATPVDRQVMSRMRLMYVAPLVLLVLESRSLLPKNWASYHHTGFAIRSVEQPWNRWRIDRSTEGHPISIAGVAYSNGIGTHPRSVIRISPTAGADVFSGACGVQDGWLRGSVRCHVSQRGVKLWSSKVLTHGKAAQKFMVTIAPNDDIILEIDDGGDQYNSDISNWVDLHFSHM
jgi:hypothetical protein